MSVYTKLEDVVSLAKKGVLISNNNYDKVCKAIENLPTIEVEDCISKRVISDSLLHRISKLNAQGETASARELIRVKKFVDDMATVTERSKNMSNLLNKKLGGEE